MKPSFYGILEWKPKDIYDNSNKNVLNSVQNTKNVNNVKWTALAHPSPKLNKTTSSPKPSGPFKTTLSQILIFVIIITL